MPGPSARPPVVVLAATLFACGTPPAPSDDDAVVPEAVSPAPMLRLPSATWARAVEDLLGVEVDRSRLLEEPQPGGFDRIADHQVTADLTFERLAAVTHDVVQAALSRTPTTQRIRSDALGLTLGSAIEVAEGNAAAWWVVTGPDTGAFTVEAPFDGTYTLTLRASRYLAWWDFDVYPPDVAPEVTLTHPASGTTGTGVLKEQLLADPDTLSITVPLTAGTHPFTVDVTANAMHAAALEGLTVVGTPDDPGALDSPSRAALVPCDPDTLGPEPCATAALEPLMRRAWRRPVDPVQRDRLLGLFRDTLAAGSSFDEALGLAFEAVVLSPRFTYRIEAATDAPRLATPHELATRLALFLWNSIPDDPLLDCADAGGLGEGDGDCSLSAQVDRMLDDPRAEALSDAFGHQWLQIDHLEDESPAPELFPGFGDDLRADMEAEATALLEAVRTTPVSLATLLTTPPPVRSEALTAHYGGASEQDDLGLLRLGAALTATSQPRRTSPTVRGAWVLDRLACDPPDPPPAQLPEIEGEEDFLSQLDAHTAIPSCAACHTAIDPLGFALEGFDPVGRPRASYRDGSPLRTAATLADGTDLYGPRDVVAWLTEEDRFARCFSEQLSRWALARELTDTDAEALGAVHDLAARGASWRTLVHALVRSDPFQAVGPQRADDEEAP